MGMELDIILEKQRKYYGQGETLDVEFRIMMLKKLKNWGYCRRKLCHNKAI